MQGFFYHATVIITYENTDVKRICLVNGEIVILEWGKAKNGSNEDTLNKSTILTA